MTTSEYSNDNQIQVVIAMKVEQEQGKVNQTQTQGFVIEVRAPSSTSPPSPEGFRPLPLSQRCYKDHRSTQLHNFSTSNILVVKRPQTLSFKNSLPLQRSLENNE